MSIIGTLGRARVARRIAAAAAFGGGGLGIVGAGAVGLLLAEARLARKWVGAPETEPPSADGTWGYGSAEPITLCMLGDSSAAGLGVHEARETPAHALASGLSEVAERPVQLCVVAFSGAQSRDLDAQVDRALESTPDIAVIMIGANDVTHRVRPAQSVRHLDMAVRRLREAGVEVVVGTCPDLGTVKPIAQPLRWVARQWSRQLAAAQTIAVVEAGGRTVSLGDLLGPEFDTDAAMFGPDRFHPSAAGYASAAAALLPSVCAALHLWPAEPAPAADPVAGVLPVATAAAEAAAEPGTEVAAVQVDGRERGPRGRWAALRHRRRRPLPAPAVATDGDDRGEPPGLATAGPT